MRQSESSPSATASRPSVSSASWDTRAYEAEASDSLGYAHHLLGRCDEAIGCYRQAYRIFGELSATLGQARMLIRVGDTQLSAGQPAAAADAWQQAVALLDQLQHPEGGPVRGKLRDLWLAGIATAAARNGTAAIRNGTAAAGNSMAAAEKSRAAAGNGGRAAATHGHSPPGPAAGAARKQTAGRRRVSNY